MSCISWDNVYSQFGGYECSFTHLHSNVLNLFFLFFLSFLTMPSSKWIKSWHGCFSWWTFTTPKWNILEFAHPIVWSAQCTQCTQFQSYTWRTHVHKVFSPTYVKSHLHYQYWMDCNPTLLIWGMYSLYSIWLHQTLIFQNVSVWNQWHMHILLLTSLDLVKQFLSGCCQLPVCPLQIIPCNTSLSLYSETNQPIWCCHCRSLSKMSKMSEIYVLKNFISVFCCFPFTKYLNLYISANFCVTDT